MWNHRRIKSIKPRERAFRLSEDTKKRGGGRLILEVKPNGAKYFFFQYFRNQNGKSKRVLVTIGRFKESAKTTGMSLADAREQGSEYESLLKKGIDIKTYLEEQGLEEQAKVRKIEAAKRRGSFAQLIESYLAAMEADGKRSFESVGVCCNTFVDHPGKDKTNITRFNRIRFSFQHFRKCLAYISTK